jgi:hypothetical protein
MATIIAGMFETLEQANMAADELRREFSTRDVGVFHINPPGQHATYPIGGDELADPGAKEGDEDAGKGTTAGAIAGGVAGAVGGPGGAALGAAVGAYTGSMVGAMQGLGARESTERPGGVMVAVNASDGEERALDILRARNADGIERAQGEWRDGDWTDFDPAKPPSYVDPAQTEARNRT